MSNLLESPEAGALRTGRPADGAAEGQSMHPCGRVWDGSRSADNVVMSVVVLWACYGTGNDD